MKEKLILVDNNDNPIGTGEKLAVHEKGLLHRAFSVFVLRHVEHGVEILLQQRHADKYHAGGLWTNSCCGHPRPGEDTQAAAERRLQEETGIILTLKEIGVFQYRAEFDNGLVEHEVDHVFMGDYEGQVMNLHPKEIDDIAWHTLDWIKEDLHAHPDKYTPWFGQALVVLEENL